jgi:hypothetical protein
MCAYWTKYFVLARNGVGKRLEWLVYNSHADTMKVTEKCADEKRPPSSSLELNSDEKTRREPRRRTTNSDKDVNADDAVVPTFLLNREVCKGMYQQVRPGGSKSDSSLRCA